MWNSKIKILGLPLVSIGVASCGWISIGWVGIGVINISQAGVGVFCISQAGLGVFSLGQLSVGVISVGQLALGLLLAVGMVSAGLIVNKGNAGFYQIDFFNDPEYTTFSSKFDQIVNKIEANPFPFIIWCIVCTFLIILVFKIVRKKMKKKNSQQKSNESSQKYTDNAS